MTTSNTEEYKTNWMPSQTKTKATSSTREKSSTSMPNMTKPSTANPEEY